LLFGITIFMAFNAFYDALALNAPIHLTNLNKYFENTLFKIKKSVIFLFF